MVADSDQIRREDIRLAVRDYLVTRPTVAQTVLTITRRIKPEVDAAPGEVEAALEFWAGLDQVSFEYAAAGSTKYWKITAAGTLAHERGA